MPVTEPMSDEHRIVYYDDMIHVKRNTWRHGKVADSFKFDRQKFLTQIHDTHFHYRLVKSSISVDFVKKYEISVQFSLF